MRVPIRMVRSDYIDMTRTGDSHHVRSGVTNAPARSFTGWEHQDDRGWHA